MFTGGTGFDPWPCESGFTLEAALHAVKEPGRSFLLFTQG